MGNTAFNDISGKKFSMLTVIERVKVIHPATGKVSHKWLCECECGNRTRVVYTSLNQGKTRSCGCLQANLIAQRNLARSAKNQANRNQHD